MVVQNVDVEPRAVALGDPALDVLCHPSAGNDHQHGGERIFTLRGRDPREQGVLENERVRMGQDFQDLSPLPRRLV